MAEESGSLKRTNSTACSKAVLSQMQGRLIQLLSKRHWGPGMWQLCNLSFQPIKMKPLELYSLQLGDIYTALPQNGLSCTEIFCSPLKYCLLFPRSSSLASNFLFFYNLNFFQCNRIQKKLQLQPFALHFLNIWSHFYKNILLVFKVSIFSVSSTKFWSSFQVETKLNKVFSFWPPTSKEMPPASTW